MEAFATALLWLIGIGVVVAIAWVLRELLFFWLAMGAIILVWAIALGAVAAVIGGLVAMSNGDDRGVPVFATGVLMLAGGGLLIRRLIK